MLNRLSNELTEDSPARRQGTSPWRVDQYPGWRLAWLLGLLALPVLCIGVRLAWIQAPAREQFLAPWRAVRTSVEHTAVIDGRILSIDGQVLAHDEMTFDVEMHYRWLESPPDPAWLRKVALSRLEPADRRDSERLEAEVREVERQHQDLWKLLPRLLQLRPAELQQSRGRIQERVERIVASVDQRAHAAAAAGSRSGNNAPQQGETAGQPWQRAWQTVRTALTTPPRRRRSDPIVVREELDYHLLARDVSLQVAAQIEAHPERFPGLRIHTSTRRLYPAGSNASHLIGLRQPATEEELQRSREQQPASTRTPPGPAGSILPGDRLGRSGIERTADSLLRGVRGQRQIVRNRQGEIIETRELRPARPGSDVVLTINLSLQQRLEEILDRHVARAAPLPVTTTNGNAGQPPQDETGSHSGMTATGQPLPAGGCLIAMDVQSGALLALASAPRIDLADLQHPTPEVWEALRNDPRQPFFHRAVAMALPPGSVFKPVTAAALLESGRWDPDAGFECRGYLDRPDRHRCYIYRHFGVGHGPVTLTDALCQSCNVYFFAAARKLGPEIISAWADRFGFGTRSGIDLPGESAGNVATPPAADPLGISGRHRANTAWYPGDTLGLAIGQSRTTVTPLQITRMMAAIANGGWLVTPHVIQRTGLSVDTGADSRPAESQPARRIPGLRSETVRRIREGLAMVVSSPRGTGYKTVRLDEIAIAGKTGTAEVGGGRGDHAWFAGYVPADQPRIAFTVVLEHAGSGGRAAGPAARELVQSLLELDMLPSGRLARR